VVEAEAIRVVEFELNSCVSWLASDGGLAADQPLEVKNPM
jgi:hypothetical protein